MSGKYDDIIHLSRPVSDRHARMTDYDRAAQFSPFAALTGYDDVITEAGRLTEMCSQLDESTKLVLNEQLQQLLEQQHRQPQVTVLWFRPDERKDGGAYLSVTGNVKKVDVCGRFLLLTDGNAIPFDGLRQIIL